MPGPHPDLDMPLAADRDDRFVGDRKAGEGLHVDSVGNNRREFRDVTHAWRRLEGARGDDVVVFPMSRMASAAISRGASRGVVAEGHDDFVHHQVPKQQLRVLVIKIVKQEWLLLQVVKRSLLLLMLYRTPKTE